MKDFPHTLPSPRRIYKTGDLVRYNPNGSIEYISRKDHQVKLHGQRMELGEIEHRLYEDSHVRHAVVILPKAGPLQQRLVTVLSLNSLHSTTSVISDDTCELISQDDLTRVAYSELIDIQTNLETQLPIYMVPQTWAAIKELPMLISGKLDRKKITAWVENIDESTYDRIMQDYDNIKRGTVESSTEDDEEAPVNAIRNILAQVLNLPSHKIDPTRSFVSLGGDSITGMAVISRARKQGINLKLQNVLRSKSILELTQAVGARASTLHDEGKHGEFFDPSPIQTLYLQSADTLQGTGRFNQSMTVRITRRITPDVVKRALRGILDQHSMLRARFSKSRDGRWQQKIVDDVDSSHRFRIHFVENPREILPKVAESQLCLNIQKGPVFAADLFEVNGDEQVLFLVAHHLCVDMVSWRIVLQDMQEFIESGSLALEKPLSFQNWCHLQLENSKKEDERPKLPFLIESPNLSYWGMENSPNTYGQVKMENFVLDKETTSFILGGCHETLRTETIDVLLSTVVQSFRRVFADRKMPAIYNEGHGRESWDSSIDLSRTVGWFTTLCPLQVDECPDLLDTVKRIKDTRRKITHNDQCFFSQSLLHPTNKNGSTDFSVPLEIMFNYLGQLQQLERDDSLFQHYGETFNEEAFNLAGDMGPDTVRFALFEISAVIIKEQLHVLFTYNRHMKHEEQIQAWISECKQTLEIDVLRLKASAPEPTLSDYPLLPITYDGLQKLVKNLPRVGIQSWDRVEDIYPCSPVQEGIILSQLRDPNAYMFYTIFEVSSSRDSGKIDPTRLRKAWSTVVSRHPVLRTLFIDSNYENGSFDQLVVKGMDDDVLVFECDDSDALNRLDAISLREINTRRASKLLHQLAICKTRSGRVLTKIEINHAIIDGGSIGLLLRDLALAYDNQLSGAPGPLFSDYIKYIRAQSQDQALTHWVQYLYGVRPCHLSFPTGATGGRQLRSLMMSFNRFPELQQFCEKNSVTLANLTLSAWAIVLRSFTGSDDICFGYPSAGRDAPVPGIQAAVGIFINMLCCRVKFTPGQTLFDIFRMVEDDYIKSLPHQSCSLANIQHEIGRQGQTLFNTTISIQNQSAWKDTGAKALSFDLQKAHDPTEYPVTVNVQTGKGGEGILLRYWTDALSENNARNLADSIAKVFTCFIDKPSQLISELELPDGRPTKTYSIVDGQAIDNISLQKMIDSRVNEIISQMLREGMLAIPAVQGMEKRPQNGTLPVKEVKTMPRERDLSDSTLTLTDYDIKSTHFEKKLCKLWSLALPLSSDTVKRHDSFFKLGGDSIAAMKMVSAARQDGLALTVADVFNNPVFEDMLGVVSASNSSPASEPEFQMETDSEKSTEPDFIMPETPPPQEMSVLRTADLDDNTLQVEICPKIGVFRGGIADVLPVTDFQAMSITASQFKSRWMLNYFYLDGKGTLDLRRLRGSILQVVDAFDILRTVFVCFQGQFFQAVLRKVRPNIFVHETEMSLDEYTESLQEEDRRKQAREGEQYVQFYIVKKKDTDQHRILLRISHAQFDGVCLPSILSAIKLGYEGTPLPQVPSFANYMRSLSGIITPKHYQHWTTLLKGSRMTEIVRRGTSNTFQHIGAFAEMKKTIEIQSTILGNITTATVMQAAWAITLAKLCAQSDVVFGLTISGRNAPIPGIESTVGPCLNVIPVRVKFRERWTGLDLLRYIQDQQVANMPFESLGFREIIRHCTDWPDSTYFTTSVFHQSVEYEGQMQMEDITYRMGGAGVIDNFADLILFSKFSSHGKLGVSLGYSLKGPIHSTFAAQILDMVCETAKSLVSNHNIMLPSPYAFRSLPCQAINDIPRLSDEMFLSAHLKNRNISKLLVHSDILTKTWQQVLPHGTEDIQTPFQLDSSFFDLGGDIFNMAQVAWLLDQEGLQVPLEGLLEHPTFLGQMAVLALHNTGHDDSSEEEIIPIEEVPLPSEKPGNWGSIGKAMNLARKVTKWGSVSTRA